MSIYPCRFLPWRINVLKHFEVTVFTTLRWFMLTMGKVLDLRLAPLVLMKSTNLVILNIFFLLENFSH